jgi:hypothetical protein
MSMLLACDVLDGTVTLSAAAKSVRKYNVLVEAYDKAASTDRIALAMTVGPETMFDETIVPAMEMTTGISTAMPAAAVPTSTMATTTIKPAVVKVTNGNGHYPPNGQAELFDAFRAHH